MVKIYLAAGGQKNGLNTCSRRMNPNLWFDNVEIIAAQEIGRETVEYVSNIYKFYASNRALTYYVAQLGRKLIN